MAIMVVLSGKSLVVAANTGLPQNKEEEWCKSADGREKT